MNKLVIAFILIFLLLVTLSYAFTVSGKDYKITGFIPESGGNHTLSSENYKLKLSLGQSLINMTMGGDYKLCLGIFCTRTFEPPHHIFVSGMLNYSNGTLVTNTDILVEISYLSYKYQQKDKTDGIGNFSTKVRNIPEFITHKNFIISVYTYGDIDALYQCKFNETGNNFCKPI